MKCTLVLSLRANHRRSTKENVRRSFFYLALREVVLRFVKVVSTFVKVMTYKLRKKMLRKVFRFFLRQNTVLRNT